MYLAIDVGGSKTLVAAIDEQGVIKERQKFPTPTDYAAWRDEIADVVANLATKKFIACGIAVPGKVDRTHGLGLDMGNLPWHDVEVRKDIGGLLDCPVVVENDANLAGLSEAMLAKQYSRVLYVTISTGIGTGIIIDQTIEPGFADSEGGKIKLEHRGEIKEWEDFASGRAIKDKYGKRAHDITDEATWKQIASDIALGLFDLIAVIQPQVVIFGGSIGTYFERYKTPLKQVLDSLATPLVPIPVLKQAERPEDAVVYGCYDLAKNLYGPHRR